MSYQLLKAELNLNLKVQHTDQTKFARTIANAYNSFISRHYEIMSAGGQFVAISAGLPVLTAGLVAKFSANLAQHNDVNLFDQMEPLIKAYWTGQICIGSAGMVTITNAGIFKGPIIPQNMDLQVFISTFIGVVSAHLLTLQGQYVNFYTGVTSPWSGALLKTIP